MLRVVRFITLMLAALTMALAFCHLMEMPARMSWDAELWVGATVYGNVYRMFGTIGAFLEMGTVAATLLLAVLVRHHRRAAFRLSLAGALLFAGALALWWLRVFPANQEFATWIAGGVPADWAAWRSQWEAGHAIRAALQIVGLAALLLSVLIETPKRREQLKTS